MDVERGADRFRLVLAFVFAPLALAYVVGLAAPRFFDLSVFVLFPATATVLCLSEGIPSWFSGVIGKAGFYFWIAATSLQWLGYAVAVISGMKRKRLRATIIILAAVHLALSAVAAVAMRAWYRGG